MYVYVPDSGSLNEVRVIFLFIIYIYLKMRKLLLLLSQLLCQLLCQVVHWKMFVERFEILINDVLVSYVSGRKGPSKR